jgi:hypothetical protein
MKKRILAVLFIVSSCGAALSDAQAALIEILPASYSFDQPTDRGTYDYSDWGGQLTDGKYGVAPWYADLGNGPAYEWVGWKDDSTVNIDFTFGKLYEINKINIGAVQNSVWDVVLPSVRLYSSNDGSAWTPFVSYDVPESGANDDKYLTYSFSGLSLVARYVRVSLVQSFDGPWTFTDEIDFYHDTAASVPEPSATLLFGAGAIVMAASRALKEMRVIKFE